MQSISEILLLEREVPKDLCKNERQEILKKFVDRINDSRIKGGFKEYPAGYIAVRLYRSGYKTNSMLHMLYGSCSDSINFSAMFHLKTGSKKKNDRK